MKHRLIVWMVSLLAVATSSLALSAPIYQENFDALSTGSIDGQNGWSVLLGSGEVQNTIAASGKAVTLGNSSVVQQSNLFAPSASASQQRLTFSLNLGATVDELPGVSNDIQFSVFVLGPDSGQQYAFVYKGVSDAGGNVIRSRFEARGVGPGSNWKLSPDAPTSGNWYDVILNFDFATSTVETIVEVGGSTLWNAGTVSLAGNGNANQLRFTSDELAGFSVDDIQISGVPSPQSGILLLMGLFGLVLMPHIAGKGRSSIGTSPRIGRINHLSASATRYMLLKCCASLATPVMRSPVSSRAALLILYKRKARRLARHRVGCDIRNLLDRCQKFLAGFCRVRLDQTA